MHRDSSVPYLLPLPWSLNSRFDFGCTSKGSEEPSLSSLASCYSPQEAPSPYLSAPPRGTVQNPGNSKPTPALSRDFHSSDTVLTDYPAIIPFLLVLNIAKKKHQSRGQRGAFQSVSGLINRRIAGKAFSVVPSSRVEMYPALPQVQVGGLEVLQLVDFAP